MFAPPPAAHLTHAEIQARRAQLQAKRASAGDAGSNSSRPELERAGSKSPKTVEKQKRRPFSAGKKRLEDIKGVDKEEWKFSFRKGKKAPTSGARMGGEGSATASRATLVSMKSYPPAEAMLPPPPPAPSAASFRGSDAGSIAVSFVGSLAESEREGTGPFSGPELAKRLKAPPKRPTRRPGQLYVPPAQAGTPAGSFVSVTSMDSGAQVPDSMKSLESIGSPSPATPPPAKSPPPAPAGMPGGGVYVASKLGPQGGSPVLRVPLASPQQIARLPSPSSPPPTSSPPPIPDKSPLRQKKARRPTGSSKSKAVGEAIASKLARKETARNDAMADLKMTDAPSPGLPGEYFQSLLLDPKASAYCGRAPAVREAETILTGPKVTTQSSEESSAASPASPVSPTRMSPSSSRSGTGSRGFKRSSGEAAQIAAKRLSDSARREKPKLKRSAATAKRATALINAALADTSVRSSNESGSESGKGTASESEKKSKARKSHGKTMVMLQTSGFLPANKSAALKGRNPNFNLAIPAVPTFTDRNLPDTLSSIAPTPAELYHAPRSPLAAGPKRKSEGMSRRSPLSQIAEVNAKANSAADPADVSLHRLTTLPGFMSPSENSNLPSGAVTPVATQIHFRGGSIVTVTLPELTAWQRSYYVQGPIKLPNLAILPRKNSVASMESFQEAIDEVYQSALFIPRRRSDDAVVDEICDFFNDFGFDTIGFEGDMLTIEEEDDPEEVEEVDEMDTDGSECRSNGSQYSTPPDSPTASKAPPIEKTVAKDMIEAFMSKTFLPPVQTAEALRARGIARLSEAARRKTEASRNSQYVKLGSDQRTSRTQSMMAMEEEESVLPLLPPPGESMLDAVLEPSQSDKEGEEGDIDEIVEHDGDKGGMDWDDDVEEMDGSWTYRKRARNSSLAAKDKKNPISRVRRFVTTATTVL